MIIVLMVLRSLHSPAFQGQQSLQRNMSSHGREFEAYFLLEVTKHVDNIGTEALHI
jgi:hypothetical protein